MYDEWVKVLLSISCDIPRFCRQAVDAEVDNSNQMNKSGFKFWKNNKECKTHESDAGLFTHYFYEMDQRTNTLWVSDMEHLPLRINEANEWRLNRYIERHPQHNDLTSDELNESRNTPWGEQMARVYRVRDKLNEYIHKNPFTRCGETSEQNLFFLHE
jgi:hypothetical protein